MESPAHGGNSGVLERAREFPVRRRTEQFESDFFGLAERNASVERVFLCIQSAMMGAECPVRAPDRSASRGWNYRMVPDHPVRLTAARLMAQILRLTPTVGGVTVDARTQTVNVTATERLAELDSLGVPREMVARACEDLLKVATTGSAGTGEDAAGK